MQLDGVRHLLEVQIKSKVFTGANGARIEALRDLSFALKPNSFTILFGPSGCGKSTLLRLISDLDQDYQGEIKWREPPKIGFVFQEPRLLPWRTVKDNILLSRDEKFSDEDFEKLILDMGLEELRDNYPAELSLGLARRVAIARAFATRPNLLLLDEPFVSLDAPTAARLRKLIRNLWQSNPITAVMVTHDIREAVELAEEIILLTPRPGSVQERINITANERKDEAAIEAKRAELKARLPELFDQ